MSDFPVFERHMGVWEGTYNLLDCEGKLLYTHQSRLEIGRKGTEYFQRNIYTWPDGKVESNEYPGKFADGRLWLDIPRLKGSAVEVGTDDIVLIWNYKENPAMQMAELIHLVDDTHRCRTWQFIENGKLTKVMAITEEKVG